MATEAASSTEVSTAEGAWKGGVLAGIAGGVVMGAMLSVMMAPVLEMAIPSLYGIAGPAGAVGWVIHVSHGAVLGVAFAAILQTKPGVGGSIGKSAGAGAAYGVGIWVVLAAIVMPVWLGTVGFGGAPSVPNFNPMSLVAHVVYGVVLGAVFPLVADL
ncbi:DUF6789 family protein [Haloparvum sp. PAK95]|uniref:DUF6789 family protein n=1 Tax=Haloparvum sp. PAK95 TaxID=3418962 RepID=UPI003D2F0112